MRVVREVDRDKDRVKYMNMVNVGERVETRIECTIDHDHVRVSRIHISMLVAARCETRDVIEGTRSILRVT